MLDKIIVKTINNRWRAKEDKDRVIAIGGMNCNLIKLKYSYVPHL
jgi:hypothetical protein